MQLKPERALRRLIVLMSQSLIGHDSPDRYTRIMLHELAQPIAGLAMVVETLIGPRARLLRQIVAHSIIGQLIHYMHSGPVITLLYPEWKITEHTRRPARRRSQRLI